jgi:hypothetical protein
VGAFHVCLWVFPMTEAWGREASEPGDEVEGGVTP